MHPLDLDQSQGLDSASPMPTSPTTTAGQAGDDDIEEGYNAGDDGLEDRADAVNDGHEASPDGAENGLDLWKGRY